MMHSVTRVSAILAISFAGLVACAQYPLPDAAPEPDLSRRPLIIIPGMQGSRLVSTETGRTVWGAELDLLLGATKLEKLSLPVGLLDFSTNSDDLVTDGIITDTIVQDFYGELIDALERSAGYGCVSPAEIQSSTNCVLFAWDWRRDLVEASAKLGGLIDQLRAARSAPNMQVDILAHSAGGLVARYFVRFGGEDVLDAEPPAIPPLTGSKAVNKALLIAPPNEGSIYGLQRAMRGTEVGLFQISPDVMATMPSVYQLLPHPDRPWIIDLNGQPVAIDLYDVETWRSLEEGIFRREKVERGGTPRTTTTPPKLVRFFEHALERGARFQRTLSKPVSALTTRYFLLGASCKETPAFYLLGREDRRPAIRLNLEEAENLRAGVDYRAMMVADGDGRVTVNSLIGRLTGGRSGPAPFPFEAAYFGCAHHANLPSHSGLVATVLSILEP